MTLLWLTRGERFLARLPLHERVRQGHPGKTPVRAPNKIPNMTPNMIPGKSPGKIPGKIPDKSSNWWWPSRER